MTLILRKADSSLKGHCLSAPTEGLDINRTSNLQEGITQKGTAIYKSELHFVTVSDPWLKESSGGSQSTEIRMDWGRCVIFKRLITLGTEQSEERLTVTRSRF